MGLLPNTFDTYSPLRLAVRMNVRSSYMPEADSKKRISMPVDTIWQIQQSCMKHDDDMRWLVALISDTGMRLAEAEGLHINNFKLDEDIQALICN